MTILTEDRWKDRHCHSLGSFSELKSCEFNSINSQVRPKVDRKALRMMRNREAASNSRKKKREYMSTLEKQIADLSKIANTLKEENQKLKAMFFDM